VNVKDYTDFKTFLLKNKEELKEFKKRFSPIRISKYGFFSQLEVEEEEAAVVREINLFRSILDRSLVDLFSVDDELRNSVLDWVDLNNKDFVFICKNAYLNPEQVFYIFLTLEKLHQNKKDKKSNNNDT
jgi:hypothetical protein